MAEIKLDKEEEKPLDPAAERLRRKMVRLMAVSIGTMFIAVFAVLFAIVYKMNNAADTAKMVEADIKIPETFVVESVDVDGDLVIIYAKAPQNGAKILFFDKFSGSPRGNLNLR
jgi:hypothetical protein